MKRSILFLSVVILISILPSQVLANSAPVVTNVTASQRGDDSKLVDIYYNLVDTDGDNCTVWVVISDDGGATWDVPAFTFSGHIGLAVTPGMNKHVIWDAGHDIVGKVGSFTARVFADDGHGDDMVLVAAGNFKYNGITWIYVPAYFIDKYEVTNQRYCEFLNADDSTAQYWTSNMEITRHGSSGNYYYLVEQGRENYPMRYVNYYDAGAFAAWRSSMTGLNYHLPDQYEWQKAAAWDPVEQHHYTYGYHQDIHGCEWMNYNFCYGVPLPVGSFNGTGGKNNAKSYYGCYDMSGNVLEWTTEVDGSYRVVRGGVWSSDATNCTVTYRGSINPLDRSSSIGFRLVLDLD